MFNIRMKLANNDPTYLFAVSVVRCDSGTHESTLDWQQVIPLRLLLADEISIIQASRKLVEGNNEVIIHSVAT